MGEVRCKDGSTGRIRDGSPEDADMLWEVERAVLADGRGSVMDPDDLPPPVVYRAELVKRQDPSEVWKVAERIAREGAGPGRVVGQARVDRLHPARLRHVGRLSLEVHPDSQGIGLGRSLCAAVVEAAFERGVLRLELYVRADNDRAIALYRTLGFQPESLRERFVRERDGSFVDDWCLVRFA